MKSVACVASLLLLVGACSSSRDLSTPAPTTSAIPPTSESSVSDATSSTVVQQGQLDVPLTYGEACANEPSVCRSETTGSVPDVLKRSLRFPVVRPGQRCPATPGARVDTSYFGGMALGNGPVRPIIAGEGDLLHGIANLSTVTGAPGWLAFKTLWFSVPAYQGPFVIRATRLDGSAPIGFGESPTVVPLVVPPGPTLNSQAGYRTAPGGTWVKAPGCYGWQIDGLTFSEVIVVDAVLAPRG